MNNFPPTIDLAQPLCRLFRLRTYCDSHRSWIFWARNEAAPEVTAQTRIFALTELGELYSVPKRRVSSPKNSERLDIFSKYIDHCVQEEKRDVEIKMLRLPLM